MIVRWVLMAVVCFGPMTVEARILETAHVEDVLPLIDEDTWFLVDLDNCLFQGAQALGHAHWFYDQLQQRMDQGMSRDAAIADFYPDWIRTQKICRVQPIEKNFVPALLDLQHKNITIMGLTHRQPLVADSTLRQVNSLGLDFSKTAPSKNSFSVPAKTPTLYSQGILFAGDYNKKIDIFEPFLAILNKTPKKIVFIDDKRKNVEELEYLTKHGIEYVGVHYTAIEHCRPVYRRDIAEFQYKFLDQILSNEAASILIEQQLE